MSIIKLGNIRVRKDTNGDTVIIKNPSAINESVKYINEFNIKKVYVDDFDYNDLNFLKECSSIEELSILNHFIKDLNGIYSLTKLRVLSINETTTKSEFRVNELKKLEGLHGTLPKKTTGIDELKNLKRLSLWGYKPKSKNLIEFKNLGQLSNLVLTQSNIVTLEGLGGLINIKELQLNYLRSLRDISALKDSNATLIDLEFENCKSVQDFSPIQYLTELENLKIFNCGEIESISFVKKLPKLKMLSFPETTILDGNLTVCDGIDYVYYTKQKSKNQQFTGLNTNLQDLTKPTIEWTKRMDEGDNLFTTKNIEATNKVLDDYIFNLVNLGEKPKEIDIMLYVKDVVIRLNEINDKYDYFIETMEREELFEFISEAAHLAGLTSEGDITEEWREW